MRDKIVKDLRSRVRENDMLLVRHPFNGNMIRENRDWL